MTDRIQIVKTDQPPAWPGRWFEVRGAHDEVSDFVRVDGDRDRLQSRLMVLEAAPLCSPLVSLQRPYWIDTADGLKLFQPWAVRTSTSCWSSFVVPEALRLAPDFGGEFLDIREAPQLAINSDQIADWFEINQPESTQVDRASVVWSLPSGALPMTSVAAVSWAHLREIILDLMSSREPSHLISGWITPEGFPLWGAFGEESADVAVPDDFDEAGVLQEESLASSELNQQAEEAVIVYLKSDPETIDLLSLHLSIVELIEPMELGQLDGNEIGRGEVILYLYGPDANALWLGIEPLIRALRPGRGSSVVKRFGNPGMTEVRVDLG